MPGKYSGYCIFLSFCFKFFLFLIHLCFTKIDCFTNESEFLYRGYVKGSGAITPNYSIETAIFSGYLIKGGGLLLNSFRASETIVGIETAESILLPNGRIVGTQLGNNPAITTVSRGEAETIVNRLIQSGAKVTPKANYPGTWYQLPQGGGFGVRGVVSGASKKLGSSGAIDINISGIPIKNIKF